MGPRLAVRPEGVVPRVTRVRVSSPPCLILSFRRRSLIRSSRLHVTIAGRLERFLVCTRLAERRTRRRWRGWAGAADGDGDDGYRTEACGRLRGTRGRTGRGARLDP